MGFDTRGELLASYAATPVILRVLLTGVTDEQSLRRPDPASWALVEIVAHLADAESRAHARVHQMLAASDPVLAAYDEAVLAAEQRYLEQSLAAAVTRFEQERAAQLATLQGLTAEQWQRSGRHAEVGSMTIETYTAHMAAHDSAHLAQIAQLLAPA